MLARGDRRLAQPLGLTRQDCEQFIPTDYAAHCSFRQVLIPEPRFSNPKRLRQSDLGSSGEIFKDLPPGGIIGGATSMTFVDDDQVKKAGREIPEDLLALLRSRNIGLLRWEGGGCFSLSRHLVRSSALLSAGKLAISSSRAMDTDEFLRCRHFRSGQAKSQALSHLTGTLNRGIFR